jgi:hypothetical protein
LAQRKLSDPEQALIVEIKLEILLLSLAKDMMEICEVRYAHGGFE